MPRSTPALTGSPPRATPAPIFLKTQALDAFHTRHAICNVLHGAPATFSEDLAAAFCRAINDWVAREWLDKDDRLRASIVVPMHSRPLAQ
jgi:predicted TIM-barrel fold metal-dependent hydrolase